MLYILGGSSRSGKSIIARRFVKEKQIPFFCIDFLITSLQEIGQLDIRHGQDFITKAEKLWPLLKPMLAHLLKEEPDYLIEGDGILPKNASEFIKEYPGQIKACFVGFSEMDPKKKLQKVRDMGGSMDDWTRDITDEKLIVYIKEMIEFSKYLKEECKKYDIKYFDSSDNFEGYLEEVYRYLTKW